MIKFGQVQAYDKTTGEATIVYMRPDACAKCGACGGGGKSRSIRLKADCAVGDWVKVELPDGGSWGPRPSPTRCRWPASCWACSWATACRAGWSCGRFWAAPSGLACRPSRCAFSSFACASAPNGPPASAPSTPTSRTSTTSAAAAANNPLNCPRGGGKSSPPPLFCPGAARTGVSGRKMARNPVSRRFFGKPARKRLRKLCEEILCIFAVQNAFSVI